MYYVNDKEYTCSISITIDIFNDSWKLAIIWFLFESDKRYKELNVAIPHVSQKTLTSKLKELEAKGLINREAFPEIPPKVVYSLTPLGRKIKPIVDEMSSWGVEYAKEHGEIREDEVVVTSGM